MDASVGELYYNRQTIKIVKPRHSPKNKNKTGRSQVIYKERKLGQTICKV